MRPRGLEADQTPMLFKRFGRTDERQLDSILQSGRGG